MILVAGSANLDFMTRVDRLPLPGETVLGSSYELAPGGKGANQAVACARAGGTVAFLGALGHDAFADTLRDSLVGSGVHDRAIRLDTPTGAAFISVSAAGENAITVASGANAHLRPEHLDTLEGVTHLVLQLESPLETVQAFARKAHGAGVQVILNAAPIRHLTQELLSFVDVLVVNQGELEGLTGETDVQLGLLKAQALGPGTVTVTLGGQGSRTLAGEQTFAVPAHPVDVVDTTGAGDTFVGVLVAGLAQGLALPDALRRASVGAALACTRRGAQPAMPTLSELEEALA